MDFRLYSRTMYFVANKKENNPASCNNMAFSGILDKKEGLPSTYRGAYYL